MGDFFRLVLSSTLSASVLILALLALRPVLRNKLSRAAQYYLWIIVLLRLAVPLTPSLGLTGWLFRDAWHQAVPAAIVHPATPDTAPAPIVETSLAGGAPAAGGQTTGSAPYAGMPVSSAPEKSPAAADLFQVAGVVWLAGMCAVLLVKSARYAVYARHIRKDARPCDDDETRELLAHIAGTMGVSKTPGLYVSAAVGSPMLLGLFRPVIVLPDAAANGWGLSYVLRHELTHRTRLDILYKWFNELVLCMHWFNPLVYLMTRRIGCDCELSCDEAVVRHLDKTDKMAYGRAVLDAAAQCAQAGLLSAGLRGGKTNMKERLGTIMKGGKKSTPAFVAALALASVLIAGGILLGACAGGDTAAAAASASPSPSQSSAVTPTPTPSASAVHPSASANDEKAVRSLVAEFGKALQNVSLVARPDILQKSIDDNYTAYVTPELLAAWKATLASAPGRLTSSPWPDRIEILSTVKNADGSYTITGNVVEVTSTEVQNGGYAAKRTVTVKAIPSGEKWLISEFICDAVTSGGSTDYVNTHYGFCLTLPAAWMGYSVVSQTWNGTWVDDGGKPPVTGPELLLRSPKWTAANPTQDIPIMIFSPDQWTAVSSEKLAVSAAPIPPSELGRNSKYVFALPARYNFAFLPGYEEVEKILEALYTIEPSAELIAASSVPSSALKITYNGVPMQDVTIMVGEAVTFKYSAASESTDTVPVWSTDNDKVISVSRGKVIALSKGTTTLTLTVGGATAQCVIRVK